MSLITKGKIISTKNISLKELLINPELFKEELKIENLRAKALEAINTDLFHNERNVINQFEWILNRKIEINFKGFRKATTIRHDIVHRNGFNTKGHEIIINKSDVVEAITNIITIGKSLRSEIDKPNW